MKVITLTTDFGNQDWFVGTMKGVIWNINPRVHIADITHAIPAGGIAQAAFALAAGCSFFPPGTIHVAVVDPGVGSARAALLVRTSRFFYLGPDNGVLTLVLRQDPPKAIRRLENPAWFRKPVSTTFHGRDIFAAAAAHLSRGIPPAQFGPPQDGFVKVPCPTPTRRGDSWIGQVLYIDCFGNAITNLSASLIGSTLPCLCRVKGKRIPFGTCYQSVPMGDAVGLWGSHGYLEIAVNGGSAAKRLGLAEGSTILLSPG